ncbi:UxaA family hydrolase [Lachnospiraceae bacterium NSJ-143]|nr:UxaA family hydrolase [Lachnospiraceae bacterium NSJ-143]
MSKKALMLRPVDTVATVVEDIEKGDSVCYLLDGKNESVTALEDIPAYHKIALKDMAEGEHVIKYGQIIGAMTSDAKAGNWISHKNIMSLPRNYEDEL